MPTTPEYLYTPIYGCDAYEANGVAESAQVGGGADVTNDNLLISLWQITGGGAQPTLGDLLKPVTAFGDWSAAASGGAFKGLSTKGFSQQFKSRVAARFSLNVVDKSVAGGPYLAVLNPPSEMRERLADAIGPVVANAGAPDGWSLQFNKSIMDVYDWDVEMTEIDQSGGEFDALSPSIDAVSIAGSVIQGIPLLRTNGADGVFPQFYPAIEQVSPPTISEIQEVIDGLKRGDFYVPIILAPFIGSPGTEIRYTIKWPHSLARG